MIVWLLARVCHPSTLRMVICPEASSAQNSMAAVSAQGSTVWVLIRRLNSSCNRSIVFEVRIDFHWLGGSRVNVNRHRQLERAVYAPAASVRSPSCQKAAILETSRQVAKARSREARRKSAVTVSG